MIKTRILEPSEIPWETLDRFADRTVFQTREWLSFIAETQRAKPVVVELREGGDIAGYFTGLTFQKLGVRILGSSFPGWATPYMGFNLVEGASRRNALEAIESVAFGPLKCLHLEVSDRNFTVEDGASLGFQHRFFESYETDLRRSEEELFAAMNSACRRCVRKAEKSGVEIREAYDAEFADQYYAQLQDVFEKQRLVPTYDAARVRALIRHLLPTGRLLLLRAISPDGECIGTGIYPALNRVAEFWGNASFRSSQILRPNEALHWHAMRHWKARGVETFDWGGGGGYKEKYGPAPSAVPWFFKSRYRMLVTFREQAQKAIRLKQVMLGSLRARNAPAAKVDEHDA